MKNSKKTSKLIKRIGITFVIPILMLILGVIIVLSAGWTLWADGLEIASILFNKPGVAISENQYLVNNILMNRPSIGDKLGTLEIPALDFKEDVYHGDSDTELRKGIGHFAGSTMPGENGNVIISAHRDRVFRPLENISVGEQVIFTTTYGTFKYQVSEIKIVDQNENYELRVLDYERLTMYTCYPFTLIGNATQRMIIICDFIESL